MNCKNPGFLSFVNMYTGSWRIFLMSNYLVYCTWIEQALDSMIVWICTRVPEVSFLCASIYMNSTSSGILDLWTCTRYSGRSSLCTVRDLYKPWITWLCEHVHVILADLPCVSYMNCTSPGFLDCVNIYTLSWPIFLVYCTWIVLVQDSLIVWTRTRYPDRSSLCTVHELYKHWILWLCEHVHLASNRYSPPL